METGQRSSLHGAQTKDFRHPYRWVVAGSMLLASAIQANFINAAGLWRDEATSLGIGSREVKDILAVAANREANMGLYYLLLHYWIAIGGPNAVWLRTFSALCIVLAVPAVAWVAYQLAGNEIAMFAAPLFSVNAAALAFGLEARGYALALLLAVLAVGSFLRTLSTGNPLWAVAFVAAATFMVYAQMLTVLLMVPLIVLGASRRDRGRRRALGATAATLLLVAPLALYAITHDRGQVAWIRDLDAAQIKDYSVGMSGSVLEAIVYAAAAGQLCFRAYAGRALKGHPFATPRLTVVAWATLPIVLLLAVSLVKPLFVPRYSVEAVPALSVMMALALQDVFPRRSYRYAAVIVVTLCFAVGAAMHSGQPRPDDIDAAARYVSARSLPGDGVAYGPAAARSWFGYYFRASPTLDDFGVRPGMDAVAVDDVYANEYEPVEYSQAFVRHHRVWVVTYENWTWKQTPEPFEMVMTGPLRAQYHVVDGATFGDATIELWER